MRKEFRKGSWALVTGASSGMGLEYCRQLAAESCNILMVSIEREKLNQLSVSLAEEFGVEARGLYSDLSRPEAAQELFEYCQSEGLEIEVLVNNAGMFFFEEIAEANRKKAETMLRLHVDTTTSLIFLFGEEMKKRGRGFILNMSSICAGMNVPGLAMYASSKNYIRSLSKSLYYEYWLRGVNMCVVCPGAVATPLYRLKASLMKIGLALGVINTPEYVVRRGLKGLRRGRREMKPGLMPYYLPFLVAILPKCLIRIIWRKMDSSRQP